MRMGTERYPFPSSSFTKYNNKGSLCTNPERSFCLASLASSGSIQDSNTTEGAKWSTGVPTIEVSDLGDDRGIKPYAKDDNRPSARVAVNSLSPSPNPHPFSTSRLTALKKKTYHVLSLAHGDKHEDGLLKTDVAGTSSVSPAEKRRAVSMPAPNHQQQTHMDGLPHRADPDFARGYLASGSPPLVDFTRFEDRYRSPSSDYNGLITISNGNKSPKAMSLNGSEVDNDVFARIGNEIVGGPSEMLRNSSGRDVLYPANERKPDPRLIIDALESSSDAAYIRCLLDVDDIMRIHNADQQDLHLRERNIERGRKNAVATTRTVFGESIQNVYRYASMPVILGEREYVLPIVVVHCIEEIYRTGIYQPNLFRTLPNRSRLHELISIFDSEKQPPGSIIRSRQISSSSSSLEGFGAATSLHLESTPDICALLASYLAALPEPILPPDLFEAVWKLCEIDKQPSTDLPELRPVLSPNSSAPVRLSTIPLARSYTPQSEANCILFAQLLLHLLPSPPFFLFVYLLSFFSQVALIRDENGIGIDDLSKMFGSRVFGQGYGEVSTSKDTPQSYLQSCTKTKGKGKERNGRGEAMMVWFLRRWGPLSETLFEAVDDAKIGVLHQNKRMRKDSLGKAVMISSKTAACESLGAHEAESQLFKDGALADQRENLVEQGSLDVGCTSDNMNLPDTASVVASPSMNQLPHGIPMPRPSAVAGLMTKDSAESSDASSGSSSTLPPYTARSSPNMQTIENNFNLTHVLPDPLPNGWQDVRPNEAAHPGDGNLYHSTPKKINVSIRKFPLTRRAEDSDHSDEGYFLSRKPKENGMLDNNGTIDRSVEDEESSSSLTSLHERLLDVSMPASILDFDETMPVSANATDTPPTSRASTPKERLQPHSLKMVGGDPTPRIPYISRIPGNKQRGSGLPTSLSAVSFGSDRRRVPATSVVKKAFLSPAPAGAMPTKFPEQTETHSQPRLPMSRSAGFQNRLHSAITSTPASAVIELNQKKETGEKDIVISALRERLVEVERERDAARKIVTEVRRALQVGLL